VNLLVRAYGAVGMLGRPVLRAMLRRRLGRGKELPGRVAERFGASPLPRPAGRLIWLHAASVGEMMSVLPVVAVLVKHCGVLLTTGTVTSARLAVDNLPAGALHQFAPLDVPAWVEAFLAHWRPDCAVFVESEVWPWTLLRLDALGVPRLLVNARLSARSAARWGRLPRLVKRVLGGFRYIHAQSSGDAARLEALGLRDVLTWGNLKFAVPALAVDQAELTALRESMPDPVFLAASTHPGEEAIVIAAHRLLSARFADLITIIVPRHPARGGEIAALAAGLLVARRSRQEMPAAGGIYLADTLGELGLFYRLAPFALLGNSLCGEGGGHNMIEPARCGIGVLSGRLTANFTEPVAMLKAVGALVEVDDAASLAAAAGAWLNDPAAARRAGDAGAKLFDGCADLPGRIADLILASSL
jgi:3-deoxy-D-manno-octulosonic-acid transferase